ncbi:hypothetical protein KPH14_007073 [Odynerus spinipes]|uniref:Dehydrogenase/reductase SDR family member on chromosome X n=1 Tax=Odynerus spinipes TaxID=1348599 RepID=A0AAD9RRT0_9HYME|nr:hypothetical protein KPH14_007073 [Odynerus spinipes]
MSLLISKIYTYLVYSVIACRETIADIVNAKYNKIALPHMSNKIAIVTGGSRGIGASVTKMLLQCDMEVIIACRTPSAGEKLICQIRESGITTGKAKVYQLDNASLESVHEFAKKIKQDYNKIHVLINNAGIMFVPYEETKEGFEHHWGVNYLSHFLLTALLLPLLKAAGDSDNYSRVVNVSSCAHRAGVIKFDDINSKNRFNTYAAYGQSKLAQVISTRILQTLFQENQLKIQIYSIHPGIVATELFQHTHLNVLRPMLNYLLKTPEQGATPIVYAAVSEEVKERGGIYISNCKEESVLSLAYDKSIQEQLLRLSLDQVQLNDFFQYLK